ncbi:MAG TPA: molybdopterin cofactor-binding domain-containing protein, partial [Verrucomicrobiae bacterium]|nr:molybdopterin cofactor-binding domain-containing protein [Verrucomicrobiae bacterium]
MPGWPTETKFISKDTRRVDGPIKASGRARYASDIQAEGWLYGMILRSKWPAAKITSINLDKALKIPGIKAAITVRDGERMIRYYGEELAAVAGTTKQACLDALRAIHVEAKPQQFVVKETEAKSADSSKVWPGVPNAPEPSVREHGEVDKAFGECAAVIEGFYTTPVQLHHPMETHGNTASWTDEG